MQKNEAEPSSKNVAYRTQLEWIKCLKGANINKFTSDGISNNLKRMNRTKPNQIGYIVEDLDEQVLQLKEAVEAVLAYKQHYERQIETQMAELVELNKQLDNLKRFGNSDYSANLARNLQRELGLLEADIRTKQKEIEELKKSPKYYEFVESFMLVERYKQELERLNEIEKEILAENAEMKKMDQKELDKLIKSKTIKLKKLQDHLQDIDKEILKLESNKKPAKRSKSKKVDAEVQKLQKEIDEQKKVIKEYENEITDTDKALMNCQKFMDSIETAKNMNIVLFKYIYVYMLIFELDDTFIFEFVESLNEINNIEEVIMSLRKDFDIDIADRYETKNNLSDVFLDSRGFFLSDKFLSDYSYFKDQIENDNNNLQKYNKEVLGDHIKNLLESYKHLHLYELIGLLEDFSLTHLSSLIKESNYKLNGFDNQNDKENSVKFKVDLKLMMIEKLDQSKSLFSNDKLVKRLSKDKTDSDKKQQPVDKIKTEKKKTEEEVFEENFEDDKSLEESYSDEPEEILDDF